MSVIEAIARSLGYELVRKKAQTQAPYAAALRVGIVPGSAKRGSKQLRSFADNNEWVRVAINRRKHALGRARWKIVRVDDPRRPPKPAVVSQLRDLFRFVNAKHESLRSLLDQVVEDVLVLDAGCIEKEKAAGGKIVGLWAVDGATIAVDPKWDGSDQRAPRYTQYLDFREVARLRNDELIYVMHNPRSHSPLGWSPVETLVRVIEAELYGEQYDYDALRQTAPEGLLDLGRGVPAKDVEQFRTYYEAEIAGSKSLAIFGGGGDSGVSGQVNFVPFKWSPREAQRAEYKKWLAQKIAAVFELDLLAFNLTENVNRANGRNLTAQSDVGLEGLATLVAEYITREIVWEVDRDHGFAFVDVVSRDELQQARIDQLNMSIGVTYPNEIRAREGIDPVPWGDVPWPGQVSAQEPVPGDGGDQESQPEPGDVETSAGEAAKAARPFVAPARARSLRTARPSLSYLAG